MWLLLLFSLLKLSSGSLSTESSTSIEAGGEDENVDVEKEEVGERDGPGEEEEEGVEEEVVGIELLSATQCRHLSRATFMSELEMS